MLYTLKIHSIVCHDRGFPGGASGAKAGDIREEFDPWVEKIPWRREWQPAPVFLPGESHGQRSLVGYSLWSYKESDITEHGDSGSPLPPIIPSAPLQHSTSPTLSPPTPQLLCLSDPDIIYTSFLRNSPKTPSQICLLLTP